MTKQELLIEMQNALQREEELDLDMRLDDIEEWDSLAVISIIALFDQLFSIVITEKQLSNCEKIEDILNLVIDKLDE